MLPFQNLFQLYWISHGFSVLFIYVIAYITKFCQDSGLEPLSTATMTNMFESQISAHKRIFKKSKNI